MNNKLRFLKDFLWIIALTGLVAGLFRMMFGLGATTNLTDAVPWGLWKVFNMVAGVALATSGFTVGFLVYVLKQEKFRPLLKPAIVVAFLGYGSSCTALLFDIGLPHRFWHPFLMWNINSFLFEVFWCVSLYFLVTAIELSPTVLERFGCGGAVKWLHRISFGVVVFGISLSTLHHSSLGSLFLVSPQRLHPLWYSPLLPLFFILSAMGAGLMVVVLARIVHAWLYDPEPVFGPPRAAGHPPLICVLDEKGERRAVRRGRDIEGLSDLARIAALILLFYLVLKIFDLSRGNAVQAFSASSWETWLYGFELVIGAVLPITLVAIRRSRLSPVGLAAASFSAAAGLVLNRLDVGIFGYFHSSGSVYLPSLAEWAVGLGVIAAAGLVFLFLSENLSIFPDHRKDTRSVTRLPAPTFDGLSHVWNTVLASDLHRVTLIAVVMLPVAWIWMYPAREKNENMHVQPSIGVDTLRTTLRIDGDRGALFTLFPHASHQERLGGRSSCVRCHHISMPGDKSTPCSRCHRDMVLPTKIFDHTAHRHVVAERKALRGLHPANASCAVCHETGKAETAGSAVACSECHREDMGMDGEGYQGIGPRFARSFQSAMHSTCISCHEQERIPKARKELADCSTCHPTFTMRPPGVESTLAGWAGSRTAIRQ